MLIINRNSLPTNIELKAGTILEITKVGGGSRGRWYFDVKVRDASDAYCIQTIVDAMNDYIAHKVSFERCAEIIGINFYELDMFCRERVKQALTKEEG